MITLAALVVLLPFLGAFAGLLGGRRLPQPWVACVPVAVSTVLAAVVAFAVWRSPGERTGTLTLIHTGSLPIRVGLQVDGLSGLVGVMVCCVAVAVQVYSVAYMADDRRYTSYAAFVSLFTAAMLLVVFAGDLLLLYAGWEVMGVCSYFLIGHHWEDRANSRAAVKAFLVTRLGDVGFLFGIFVLGVAAKSFTISDVLARVGTMSHTTLTAAALLLLCGVVGKSAQFPLHTWLPDAMAGPTPISALIHAATMVAAGIYFVARVYPVFWLVPSALAVLGILAVVSMVGSALAALAQDDLKRVLAYSTISQLAVMAAGLAVGARSAVLFHLVTHAAFKALLFLAAGCVIHATTTNLLARYGGLRRTMPITFWSMTVGFAALIGVPAFSGWFSKDAVIAAAQHGAVHNGDYAGKMQTGWFAHASTGNPPPPAGTPKDHVWTIHLRPYPELHLPAGVAWVIYLGLLLTVVLTAAYSARAWLMTFFGEPRAVARAHEAPSEGVPEVTVPRAYETSVADTVELSIPAEGEVTKEPSSAHAHEAPKLMTWPVMALAVPAAILGFFGLGASELRPELGSALLSAVLVAVGFGGMWLVWNRDPAADPARALGPVRPVFAKAFYLDELYALVIVRPVLKLARGVAVFDRIGIDAAVVGTARAARRLGGALRIPQNGNAQSYLTALLGGVVVITALVVIFQ
ncbi:NADH-quinone oxidoreductase subunit 5 family protein [Actinomadura rupiterrae]|uniref:NADH-quinone oxidoreductase subunit 5 family protein n=1 Tax=Actinomadura rupiterrae TaxID=559627 RepID=UPI0020A56D06|nr:NADH-quinone oxidoreductase subunit L [Actinomadura rupiterrae]MCP2343400.1 NADH-quinone oxidoreductase subunit L [Actinomadura rupiterrae]